MPNRNIHEQFDVFLAKKDILLPFSLLLNIRSFSFFYIRMYWDNKWLTLMKTAMWYQKKKVLGN